VFLSSRISVSGTESGRERDRTDTEERTGDKEVDREGVSAIFSLCYLSILVSFFPSSLPFFSSLPLFSSRFLFFSLLHHPTV
jgi:hypothetical protein